MSSNIIIKGSEFIVDTYKIGYQTCAFIGIVLKDLKFFNEVVADIKKIPEVVECHYATGKYECIDVMLEIFGVEAVKTFCLLNAFKYNYRTGNKNGLEDIKKAKWYIDKYIELSE